jgi:hypothetical protein
MSMQSGEVVNRMSLYDREKALDIVFMWMADAKFEAVMDGMRRDLRDTSCTCKAASSIIAPRMNALQDEIQDLIHEKSLESERRCGADFEDYMVYWVDRIAYYPHWENYGPGDPDFERLHPGYSSDSDDLDDDNV